MSGHEALVIVVVTIIGITVMVCTCIWAQWSMARDVRRYARETASLRQSAGYGAAGTPGHPDGTDSAQDDSRRNKEKR